MLVDKCKFLGRGNFVGLEVVKLVLWRMFKISFFWLRKVLVEDLEILMFKKYLVCVRFLIVKVLFSLCLSKLILLLLLLVIRRLFI